MELTDRNGAFAVSFAKAKKKQKLSRKCSPKLLLISRMQLDLHAIERHF